MRKVALIILSLMLLLPVLVGQDYYNVRKHTRISTGMNEAAAVPYVDGVVYITESTSVGFSSPKDSEGRRLFTIFQYKEKGGQKRPFSDALVTQRHDGPASFAGDYKTMVFSQQRSSGANRDFDPLGLYFAENVDGEWLNIRDFEYNDDFAWLFSPALSHDGRTLFFAANLPDAIGGFDIYRSELKGGIWTKPENLGPAVNTKGNELYPFFHSSGKLYFSSEGHDNSKAGFDLYQTVYYSGAWSQVVKLSPPFNSLSDDYHVYFSEDFKSGYLTSNRRGGSKDIFTFETDIPVFESPEPIKKTYYKYKIFDRKLDTVDTNLFRYSWVINDTLEIPGHEIIYQFPEPGIYICKLNVFDLQLDTLLKGQTSKTLTIRLNEQAVITCPDTIMVNTPMEFDGSNSYLPDFNVGRYLWEFGDGSYGEGIRVDHTYQYPGRYRIILGVEERKKNRRHEPEVRSNFRDVLVVEPE
ncbi:MAG: PKD domain-containing protein [Bacteroidales bacterium]|nr:PKD domain-containing protein [Bacteroidales bacterium]